MADLSPTENLKCAVDQMIFRSHLISDISRSPLITVSVCGISQEIARDLRKKNLIGLFSKERGKKDLERFI